MIETSKVWKLLQQMWFHVMCTKGATGYKRNVEVNHYSKDYSGFTEICGCVMCISWCVVAE